MSTVVFVPLAQIQTPFYLGVARKLKAQGIASVFITLHEPSLPDIQRAGFPAVSLFRRTGATGELAAEAVSAVLERFGVLNPNRIISHERAFYGITDGTLLLGKLAAYLVAMESLLSELRTAHGPLQLVQELGGFLGVAAGYFAAGRLDIANTFIEPSFFQGRVAFTRNSFGAPHFATAPGEASPEVRAYLAEVMRARRLVIPAKDAQFHRGATEKIFNRRSVGRLMEKAAAKYLRAEREEFDHIAHHVGRHIRMVGNGLRLAGAYRPLTGLGRFIYYPLHVPADVAITVRSPEYLDQFALLDYLARNVPVTHRVAFKEHPAMVGAFSAGRTLALLREHSNLVLLRPDQNNFDVIKAADVVVTVNSKAGAEAVLLGKPVAVLGDAFYRDSGLVSPVDALQDLPAVLRVLVDRAPLSWSPIEQYFQGVWNGTYPGELYVATESNCDVFGSSLAAFLAAP